MRDPFYPTAVNVMQSTFSHIPSGYQNYIIPHILQMMASNIIPCKPILLVQATRLGKYTTVTLN